MDPYHAPGSGMQSFGRSPVTESGWHGQSRSLFGLGNDTIVQAAHEAIVTVDQQQHIVMINPAAQRMFGYTSTEILGSSLSRLVPPPHRREHADHVRAFAESGTVERSMGERGNVSGLRANGQQFPAAITICQLDVASEHGPRRYFAALVLDLSESDNLRTELDELGRRMRLIFDLAPVAIWITDADRINFANHACAALFGTDTSEELMSRSVYELLRPESHPAVRAAMALALEGNRPVPIVRERIVQRDGAVRNIEMAVAALPDHGRTALQMVITDITRQTEERRELEQSRHQLRELSAGMVTAREEERRRIARELHDELGQRLTALKMELSTLVCSDAPDDRRASMLNMVDETIASVRRISTDLRPLMLDDLGLNAAIEWLAEGWQRRMGISVRLRLCSDDPPLGQAVSIALYRIVQEALTNVARHAHATKVKIAIWHEDGELVLTVRDNGVGFTEPSMYHDGSHGLMGIRERAYMLGGTMEIGNSPGGGGRIAVRLPLELAALGPATGPGDLSRETGAADMALPVTRP